MALLASSQPGSSPSIVAVALAVAAALILALILTEVLGAIFGLVPRGRMPARVLVAVVLNWLAVALVTDETSSWFDRMSVLATVAAATWLLAVILLSYVDNTLERGRGDAPGKGLARGSAALTHTVRCVVQVVVVLTGVAVALLLPSGTRVAGMACLVVVVLAIAVLAVAMVPFLRDVTAGLQLAMTDAIRLDDILSVDGEWGRVEEITATSVLLHLWDDRRIIVPTRRLTSEPFENWTRRSGDLVGSVELDLSPSIPVAEMRAKLVRLVEANDLWDRHVAVLQVVDATGAKVRVRAVMSARGAPQLMDLRCDVREGLVEWLRRQGDPQGPIASERPLRAWPTAVTDATGPIPQVGPDSTGLVDPRRDARLYTGSVYAVERSRVFTGPGLDVLAERDAAPELLE